MAVLILAALAAACAVLAAAAALAAWRGQAGLAGAMERARLAAEQARDAASGQAETTRRMIEAQGRDMVERVTALRGAQDMAMEQLRTVLSREQGELRLALGEAREAIGRAIGAQFDTTRAVLDEKLRELREGNETKLAEMQALLAEQTRRAGEQSEAARTLLDARLKELREGNEAKLAEIQKTVNEQLHAAVEKQMTESFARVIDQFAAVQKALGEFSVLSSQMGDIKRLFSNVKTRGGWGEAQVRAMLDDILPVDAYETNCRVKPDSDEAVEFAVRMPGRGPDRPLLAIDAKFPVEAYERLLSAADAGDAEAERAASRQLETAVRLQARKIAEKYINPPITVDYAVMYLPTDGLFAEIARTPGLIELAGARLSRGGAGTEPVSRAAAHDPSRRHHPGDRAEGGAGAQAAGRHRERDGQDGPGAGTAGEERGHDDEHDRGGPHAHPRGAPRVARGGGDRARGGGRTAGAGGRGSARRGGIGPAPAPGPHGVASRPARLLDVPPAGA